MNKNSGEYIELKNTPNITSYLEESDFIPFIIYKTKNNINKSIHNNVDSKSFLLICINNIENIKDDSRIQELTKNYNIVFIFKQGNPIKSILSYSTNDSKIVDLFNIPEDGINIYFASPNRRIFKIDNIIELQQLNLTFFNEYKPNMHVPYLLIDNVLSDSLFNEIVTYLNSNKKNAILHDTTSKHRYHVHPNKDLEMNIKLSYKD